MVRALLVVASFASGCWVLPNPQPVEPPFDAGNLGDPVWDPGVFTVWSSGWEGERNQPSDEFPLIRGPQGGYHVHLGLSLDGAPPLDSDVRFEVTGTRIRDNKLIASTVMLAHVSTDAKGRWSRGPLQLRLCPTPVGVNIIGEPLRFEARAIQTDVSFLGTTSVTSTLTCQDCQWDCGG